MQLLEWTEVLVFSAQLGRPDAQDYLPVVVLIMVLLTLMQQTVDHPLYPRCMLLGSFCFSALKKLKFQHNEFNVQEQGMGGTVYDRDTIMKKYMNGYDGKTLGHKHICAAVTKTGHSIVKACVCLYIHPGCQILLIGVT